MADTGKVISLKTLMLVSASKKAAQALQGVLQSVNDKTQYVKGGVDAVSVGNIALNGDGQTIDGVAAVGGKVVLCIGQADAKQNGPWDVVAGNWHRPAEFVNGKHVAGFKYTATGGTVYKGYSFVCTAVTDDDVVGTDNLPFAIDSASTAYIAGDGIALAGTTLSADVDGSTLELSANDGTGKVRVKDSGIVAAKIAANAVTTAKIPDDAVTKEKIDAGIAGSGLGQNADGSLEVKVDAQTIEINADTLRVKDSGVSADKIAANAVTEAKIAANAVVTAKVADSAITTAKIANDAIDKDKIAADVAGLGLQQNADGSLEAKVDASTIEINADTLRVKDGGIVAAKIGADAVTKDKIHANVAGTGLQQNADGSLEVASAIADGTTITGGGGAALAIKGVKIGQLVQTPSDGAAAKVTGAEVVLADSTMYLLEAHVKANNSTDAKGSATVIRGLFKRGVGAGSVAQIGATAVAFSVEEDAGFAADFDVDLVNGTAYVKATGVNAKNFTFDAKLTVL